MGSLVGAALGPSGRGLQQLTPPSKRDPLFAAFQIINANGETEAQAIYSVFAQEEPSLVHFFPLIFLCFHLPLLSWAGRERVGMLAGILLPSVP